ncbi:hypothetical protein [Prosthecobacter vanneervenii]|uniref:Uncharacterized protein n=1 Tax=Prosthecobacter vanneervenii TaxID=48466 RepID=A0A7W7YFL3_9BACT|nr:hypothetical protein [Prosthecobacter vanneervenii]MBB5035214.1 hypothetical protein [Prosthecobacter vanneervenii]
MKAILLIFTWLSCAMLLPGEDTFYYQTTSYPVSILKPWTPDNQWDLNTRYAGEFGDGGGYLQLIGYPSSKDIPGPLHFSAVLINHAVATKPKILVHEDLEVSNGAMKAKGLLIQFFQFNAPETNTVIKGALINGLFYEASHAAK